MNKDRITSRRDFLKRSAAGLAGAALLSDNSCTQPKKDEMKTEVKFIYRTLGRTGLKLPIVSMGAAKAIDLVQTALENGIVHIDTSSVYEEGNHERMLGRAFKNLPRDSFVIGTSVGWYRHTGKVDGFDDVRRKFTPKILTEEFEGSLNRLGLDYMDIYYIADVYSREFALYEPYLEACDKFKREGKTRFIGITMHRNEPEAIRAAVESEVWDVVLTAYNFRKTYYKDIQAAVREAANAGLGVIAMKTQAGVYWDKERTQMINQKAALKWVLQDENVHTAVPAFANYEEMMEDISVMEDLTLTPEEKKDLKLGEEIGLSGLYCQQCGNCVQQCSKRLDIPTLMRSYMYAFGYQEPKKAREALRTWTPNDITCASCEICDVQCALGFDVKSRVLDIARILDVPEEYLG